MRTTGPHVTTGFNVGSEYLIDLLRTDVTIDCSAAMPHQVEFIGGTPFPIVEAP